MARFLIVLCAIIVAIFMIVTGARAEVFITIDKSAQIMIVETPTDQYEWPVSTGRKGYNTPSGTFQPYLLKPMHYSSQYENAPMPNSIFFHGGYAIHATDAIAKLGRPASHGCVRLHPRDAKWLYHLVKDYGKENTYIEIVE